MKTFEQIRTRLQNHFLQKEMPRLRKISRSTMYLENARTIGILFDGTEPEDREIVLEFSRKLEHDGKKVKLLSFFNNSLESVPIAIGITFKFFNRKNLDWALRPKSADVKEFSEQPFDLLINLSQKASVPLEYIAAVSKAKFRVGPLTDKIFCYDLMIDLPEKKGLKTFIREVTFYLEKMRPVSVGKEQLAEV